MLLLRLVFEAGRQCPVPDATTIRILWKHFVNAPLLPTPENMFLLRLLPEIHPRAVPPGQSHGNLFEREFQIWSALSIASSTERADFVVLGTFRF